ncbi:MAG: M14 family zinc carboxypeptidase [Christensenellales bacterium]
MTVEEINERILALGELNGVGVFRVGYSLLGRSIYGVHIGDYTGKQIILTGAIHAREYVTSLLLIEMVRYLYNKSFNGGFYFVPLMNPDGVDLVLSGTENLPCDKLKDFILLVNDGSTDFSYWKANANAVDMNVNFDAGWGKGVQNVFCPAPANFVGYYPNSEREVRSIIDFSLKNMPAMTIDYHTRGEVIYYGFDTQTEQERANNLKIASDIAEVTGYTVERSEGSVGGYQDWSIDTLKVPSVTIEVGNSTMSYPITEEYLPVLFEQNKDVPLVALNSVNKIYSQKERVEGSRIWKGLCVRH